MKLKNRGQGAMEYLVNHAWAILVLMIIGFALWRLGVFNIGGSEIKPQVTGFERVRPLAPGVVMQPNGSFQAVFINNVGAEVFMLNLTLTDNAGDVCVSTYTAPGVKIRKGSTEIIGGGCPSLAGREGSIFDVSVRETYMFSIARTVSIRTETGRIRGAYG